MRHPAAVAAAVALLAGPALRTDTWTDASDNVWTYSIANDVATVSGVSFETTNLTIPELLGDKPVTGFTAATFKGKERAVRVTIPDTVTSIPDSALEGCGNLTAVTIQGEGLKSIGYRAFAGCGNLAEFVMPNSVTSLGQGVFSGCSAMESVTLGDGLTVLTGVKYENYNSNCYGDYEDSTSLMNSADNGLFYNCTSLKTINWGSGIKTIGNIAFLNCTSLTEVTLPANIANIGNHAFYGCASLKKATVKGSVDSLGRRAFANCPSLVYVWFQGPVMTFEPGYQPFAFDDSFSCVNAAPGSTGWKGIAEVPGLPDDGLWCGVPIKYGVPPTYTIKFNRNDSSAPQTASRTFDYGIADHLPSLSSLGWARRGFNFKGWAVSPANAAAGKVWKADWASVTTAVAAGKTLDVYAVWEIASDSYAIRFIRNDGAGTWRTVGFKHGVKTRMPSLANGLGWGRRGYEFKGWALTTADANAGKVWKGDWAYVSEPVAKGKSLDVYAVWALKPGYYQIRFNKNDGTGKWRSLGFQRDASTRLSTIAALGWTRTGYSFVGWASSKANADAGKVWKPDGEWVKNAAAEGKTLSIYAIWRKTAANVALPPPVRAQAAAAPRAAASVAAFEPIFRTGELADGSGEWVLSLASIDADGVMSGHFVVGTEAATAAYACDAVWLGDDLLVETEDGDLAVVSPDGTATLL